MSSSPHRLRILGVQRVLEACCTCGGWSTFTRMGAEERAWSYAQRKTFLKRAHARHVTLAEPGHPSVGSGHERTP